MFFDLHVSAVRSDVFYHFLSFRLKCKNVLFYKYHIYCLIYKARTQGRSDIFAIFMFLHCLIYIFFMFLHYIYIKQYRNIKIAKMSEIYMQKYIEDIYI